MRFPVSDMERRGDVCPLCGAPTEIVLTYRAAALPTWTAPPGPPVEALLDNLRSVFNVGSIFRASDGAGVRCLHLCGTTPTPEHPKLVKTALRAESGVAWRYYRNNLQAAQALQAQGYRLWALEGGPRAVSLYDLDAAEPMAAPLVLVVGNEVSGVDPALLALCDRIVFIPMLGGKESLNVATAFGIMAYQVRFGRYHPPASPTADWSH